VPAVVASAAGRTYDSHSFDFDADGIPDTAALIAVMVYETASSVVVTPPDTDDSVAVTVTVPTAEAENVRVVALMVAEPGTTTFEVVFVVATANIVPLPARPSTLNVPPEIVYDTSSESSAPMVRVTYVLVTNWQSVLRTVPAVFAVSVTVPLSQPEIVMLSAETAARATGTNAEPKSPASKPAVATAVANFFLIDTCVSS
jgi:hypothetical protein